MHPSVIIIVLLFTSPRSPKLNFILTLVVIVFIAERHNTTAGGTITADNTNTVELPTILEVINEINNILTILYFLFLFLINALHSSNLFSKNNFKLTFYI